MDRLRRALVLPFVLATVLVAARAENATAPLLAGDRLNGDIVTPGDEDVLTLFVPAGSTIDADLRAARGSAILPALEVDDAADTPIDLGPHSRPGKGGIGVRVKRAPAGEAGGAHSLRVVASGGSTGRYELRVGVKVPRKVSGEPTLPAEGVVSVGFQAAAGTRLDVAVKARGLSPVIDALRGPGGPVPVTTGSSKLRKVVLDADGDYVLDVRDASGSGGPATVQIKRKAPKASKRVLYLSPDGFGEAPRVLVVEPSTVLDDRIAEDVVVDGEGFDAAATVHLERKGQEPIEAAALDVEDDTRLTATFDVTGVKAGKWSVVVRNPSGGADDGKLKVQKAGKVKLPAGIVDGAEVWWLDFDADEFPEDLAAIGLGSSDPDLAADIRGLVEQYVVHFLRAAFGADPLTGNPGDDGVPVCFVIDEPPATIGAAGTVYNRIVIGGGAAQGDPSSNPSLPWGDAPIDAGNVVRENLDRALAAGLGVRARVLTPSVATSTVEWIATLAPFQADPLDSDDAAMIDGAWIPLDEGNAQRYRDLVAAVEAVAQELAGIAAHLVARSLGLEPGVAGIASAPTEIGRYAALTPSGFGFTAGERTLMRAAVVDSAIPGSSPRLRPEWLPWQETRLQTLPNAVSTEVYSEFFDVVGGRPGRTADEVEYVARAGTLPLGFTITAKGELKGLSPLFVPTQGRQLNTGVHYFIMRYKDLVGGDTYDFLHRLNLLADADNPSLSPAEQSNAQNVNAGILAQ